MISVISALLAVFIFRAPIDDGTELLVVSKPIARRKMITSKFLWTLIVMMFIITIGGLFFLTTYIGGAVNQTPVDPNSLAKIVFSYFVGCIVSTFVFGALSIMFCAPLGKIAALFVSIGFCLVTQVLGFVITQAETLPNDYEDHIQQLAREEYESDVYFSNRGGNYIDTNENIHGFFKIEMLGGTIPAIWSGYTSKDWLDEANKNSNIQIIQALNVGQHFQHLFNTMSVYKTQNQLESQDFELDQDVLKYAPSETTISDTPIDWICFPGQISSTSVIIHILQASNATITNAISDVVEQNYENSYYGHSYVSKPVLLSEITSNLKNKDQYVEFIKRVCNDLVNSAISSLAITGDEWLDEYLTGGGTFPTTATFNEALAYFKDLPTTFEDCSLFQKNTLYQRVKYALIKELSVEINTYDDGAYNPFAMAGATDFNNFYDGNPAFKKIVDAIDFLADPAATSWQAYGYKYEFEDGPTPTLNKNITKFGLAGYSDTNRFKYFNDMGLTKDGGVEHNTMSNYYEYEVTPYLNLGPILAFWLVASLVLVAGSIIVLARKDFK